MSERRVLIVEDEPVNSRLLEILFTRWGWRTHAVVSGQQFLDTALAGGFHLAVVDLRLPDLDGLEAIRRLRIQEQTRLPVVVVTAEAAPAGRERALAAGADSYLSKPFRAEDLESEIERLMG
ncbi:MAG: response regulator [Bryobacteraceae bacterium]